MNKTLSALILAAAALSVAGCDDGRTTTLPGDAAPATGAAAAPASSTAVPSSAPAPSVATVGSSRPKPPEPSATTLNFWNYGFVSAVDAVNGVVTVDVVQYFGGEDATRACAEDGIRSAGGAWCANYYWRNTNPLIRTVPLATGASITRVTFGNDGVDIAAPATLAQVKAQVTEEKKVLFKFYVDGGKITQLNAVYLP